MIKKATYIFLLLLLLLVCLLSTAFRETQLIVKKEKVIIRQIHHYRIYEKKKQEAINQMKDILYGYKYEPVIPKGFNFWWEDLPSNHFYIFPGGDHTIRFRK